MPTSVPEYREATVADLAAICILGQEVNTLHHQAWPDVFASAGSPDRDRDHWLQSIAKNNATTFVAEVSGKLVGFVTVSVLDETHSLMQPCRYGRVGSIGVAVQHRGKGIGPQLMGSAEGWARERGAYEMRLNVWAFNEGAMRMYEELGYEVRSHFLGKRLVEKGA